MKRPAWGPSLGGAVGRGSVAAARQGRRGAGERSVDGGSRSCAYGRAYRLHFVFGAAPAGPGRRTMTAGA